MVVENAILGHPVKIARVQRTLLAVNSEGRAAPQCLDGVVVKVAREQVRQRSLERIGNRQSLCLIVGRNDFCGHCGKTRQHGVVRPEVTHVEVEEFNCLLTLLRREHPPAFGWS